MSGYTIGLIAEGAVILILIIAIAAVVARRRRANSRDHVVNGIGGYLVHFPEDEDGAVYPERQAIAADPSYGEPETKKQEYVRSEQQRSFTAEEVIWDIREEKKEEYSEFRRVVEEDFRKNHPAEDRQGGNGQNAGSEGGGWQDYTPNQWVAKSLGQVQELPQDDEGMVKFQTTEKTFADAYAELSEEQKRFFSDILRYALSKPKAEQKMNKAGICVRSNRKPILKLKVRRKLTVASFKLENERLRDYRRTAGNSSSIRLKETEIYVNDEMDKQTACEMVDLMLDQYEREKQEARERRRAMRAAKRAEQQALKESAAAKIRPESPDGEEL